MSKRVITLFVATAAAVTLAAGVGAASGSSGASASAKATKVVPIVMADPGCHWFRVAGKNVARLTVKGTTAFRNLDEAAVTFAGKNYFRKIAVGKTLTIAKAGVYRIKMVGQHPDDNTLVLVVK